MPPFRLRSADDPRVIEAHQFPSGALLTAVTVDFGGAAHTFDAFGRRIAVRPGDWVYPERGGRGYVVSDPETFARAWEAVTDVVMERYGASNTTLAPIVQPALNGWVPGGTAIPDAPIPNVANAPDDAPDAHGDNHT